MEELYVLFAERNFRGLLFGLPIGAIGALTIQRTFNFGIKVGLITGLSSSLADCIYACIGVFGLTFVSDFLISWQKVITVIGGIFIIHMGVNSIKCIKYKAKEFEINTIN